MQSSRYKSFIICTSPRSGSTLLCKLLSATKVAGNPGSHFHTPSLARWLEIYELTDTDFTTERDALAAIFKAARKRGTSDTGIFGLRLQHGSFDFFSQKLSALFPQEVDDRERIYAAFGPTQFIHLTRDNKLDQAISYVKASQTGLWHKAPDGTELERLSAPSEPFYDKDAIAKNIDAFSAMDEAWKRWFKGQKIRPFKLSYDELSVDPIGKLETVLNELGLDGSLAHRIELPVAKLADSTNRLWANRFRAEN